MSSAVLRRLRELARRRGIRAMRYPLAPYFQGLYWRSADGRKAIALDTALRGDELARVFAHELVHARCTPAHLSLHRASFTQVSQEERRVDRGARLLLRLIARPQTAALLTEYDATSYHVCRMSLEGRYGMPALRDLRRSRGLTQAELAARVGISQSALAKYESGTRIPHYTTAVHLADVLGVTLNDLEFEAIRREGRVPPASARHDLQRAIQESWDQLPLRKLLFTPDRLPRLAVPVKDIARTFGLHGSTIRREIARGHLPAKRIGRRLVVPVTGLLDWLEARGAYFGVPPETPVHCGPLREHILRWWGAEEGGNTGGPQASP